MWTGSVLIFKALEAALPPASMCTVCAKQSPVPRQPELRFGGLRPRLRGCSGWAAGRCRALHGAQPGRELPPQLPHAAHSSSNQRLAGSSLFVTFTVPTPQVAPQLFSYQRFTSPSFSRLVKRRGVSRQGGQVQACGTAYSTSQTCRQESRAFKGYQHSVMGYKWRLSSFFNFTCSYLKIYLKKTCYPVVAGCSPNSPELWGEAGADLRNSQPWCLVQSGSIPLRISQNVVWGVCFQTHPPQDTFVCLFAKAQRPIPAEPVRAAAGLGLQKGPDWTPRNQPPSIMEGHPVH